MPGPLKMNSGDEISGTRDGVALTTIFGAIRRNFWIIAASTFLMTALGYYYAVFVAVPTYIARASVVMERSEDEITRLSASTLARGDLDGTAINTQMAIIRSPRLLRQLIAQGELTNDPEFNPLLELDEETLASIDPSLRDRYAEAAALEALQSDLSISNVPGTTVIQIAIVATDPAKAQGLVNTLVDLYLEYSVTRKIEKSQGTLDWLSSRLEEMQADLITAETRIEQFEFGSAEASDDLGDAVRLDQLTAEADAIRTLYESFLSRYEELRIQAGQHSPDSYVLDYAEVPIEPFRPRATVILFFSFVFGGLLGLGLMLLREALSDRIRRPADLEQVFGYPLLGATPRLSHRSRGRDLYDQSGLGKQRYVSAVDDVYSNLSMIAPEPESGALVVSVVSSLPGEGKSRLALSLAARAALAGRRTLLVDTDLRERVLSQRIAPDATEGLLAQLHADAGEDRPARIRHENSLGLDLLPCEAGAERPLDILSSDRFAAWLDRARARYDLIVLDTPPILAAPDVRAVGHRSDFLVFVVRCNSTGQQTVEDAMSALRRVNLQPGGMVMTSIGPGISRRSRGRGARRYLANAVSRPVQTTTEA